MNAHDLTVRLISDLEIAANLESKVKSQAQLFSEARNAMANLSVFSANAVITMGFPNLRTSIGQLIQFLHGDTRLEVIQASDKIETQLGHIVDLQDFVEAVFGRLLSGKVVAMGADETMASLITGILDDIHIDVLNMTRADKQANG